MYESDLLYKIILIGDQNVGKTSVISRFITDEFNDIYRETVGVDFIMKFVDVMNKKLKCQFWDACGAPKYRSIISAYFKGANGIIAVYDVTNKSSFNSIRSQLSCFKNHVSLNTQILIIGNKTDLADKREVTLLELEEYSQANGYICAEISAKNNYNLSETITNMIKQIYYKSGSMITNETTENEMNLNSFSLPRISNYAVIHREDEPTIAQKIVSKSEFLNVNSNTYIMGSNSFHNTEQNQTKKIIADLVEQVSSLYKDNERKDDLIMELNSLESCVKSNQNFSHENNDLERITSESLKKDLDTQQLKYEALLTELSEFKEKRTINEVNIIELKNQNEVLREEKVVHDLVMSEKLNQIAVLEADLQSYEIVSKKSEITITSLQENNNELNFKIKNLDFELNTLTVNIKYIEESKGTLSTELVTLKKQIAESLGVNAFESSSTENIILIKNSVQTIKNEAEEVRSKVQMSSSKILSAECENNICRGAIERLVSDLNKCESSILSFKQENESLRTNLTTARDSAINSKILIENQFEAFRTLHNNCENESESLRTELREYKTKKITLDEQHLTLNYSVSFIQNKFMNFKKEISRLLSDEQFKVESNEEKILEYVGYLMTASCDREQMITSLEQSITELKSLLQHERNLRSDSNTVQQHNESKVLEMVNSINSLQANLSVVIEARNNLSAERNSINDFFVEITTSLKLSNTIGRSNQNAVIKRLKKLTEIESDVTRIETKRSTTNFENKINLLEEELSNKEVHMNLLRNKIVDFEEGISGKIYGKSELKTEYNNILMENKKQKVKINKISAEYNALKIENTILKKEAMDSINFSEVLVKKTVEIEILNSRINCLTSENEKRWGKFNDEIEQKDLLRYDLQSLEDNTQEIIRHLKIEIRALNQDLAKAAIREKQLLEFRDIISKKLGLSISGFTLGDPNYVANIENCVNITEKNSLIHLQQAHSQSFVGNSTCPDSEKQCKNCPSWSNCIACLAPCSCACLCSNSTKYEHAKQPILSMKKCCYTGCKNDIESCCKHE